MAPETNAREYDTLVGLPLEICLDGKPMKHVKRICFLEQFADWSQARIGYELTWISTSFRKLAS
ncbi:hypothetical protein C664_08768 [Thauera sp. 63]|nr:hypothetical protein C664_08768 [Thauera sp. 63]